MYWNKLIKNRKFNLSDFRNTRKHNIFANWNPHKRGLTYHNYLIYNFINLFSKKRFIKFISDFYKADKVIACICSGVQLLISAKIVKGKKIAGYYSLEDDIVNAGAIYTDKPAVVDGKIVTTAHYKDMGPWMKAVLSFFNEN